MHVCYVLMHCFTFSLPNVYQKIDKIICNWLALLVALNISSSFMVLMYIIRTQKGIPSIRVMSYLTIGYRSVIPLDFTR